MAHDFIPFRIFDHDSLKDFRENFELSTYISLQHHNGHPRSLQEFRLT